MTDQSKTNKKYRENNGLVPIQFFAPKETKAAFKSAAANNYKTMTDILLPVVYKYIKKNC